MDLKLIKNIVQGCLSRYHGATITGEMAASIAKEVIESLPEPDGYDYHEKAYHLIEKLENSYYDRHGSKIGREKNWFDINEVHIVEEFLVEAYYKGKDRD